MTEYNEEQIDNIKWKVGVRFLVLGILFGITLCFIFSVFTGFSSLQYVECHSNLDSCISAYNAIVSAQMRIQGGLGNFNASNFSVTIPGGG